MDLEERIKRIEEEIRTTPYHKGTEHHIGKLRAKLARLRDELLTPKKKGKAPGFAIKKEGDATVVLLGFPSVGKSTLLNHLTSAKSKVGDYKFTTLSVIPGVLKLHGATIQVLDLPGMISEAAKGRGWGRQILAAARIADLLLLLIEAKQLDQEAIIKKELYEAGVRINEERPKVLVKKMARGGIQVASSTLSHLTKMQVIELAREFGLRNAEIIIKENIAQDRLIDALSKNRVYQPAIFAINKIDLIKNLPRLRKKFPDYHLISAKEDIGLEELKQAIWENLRLIRVFLKPRDGQPDFKEPLILEKGTTVLEAATKISKDLGQNIKGGEIFGANARHDGQRVGINYILADETILTLLD